MGAEFLRQHRLLAVVGGVVLVTAGVWATVAIRAKHKRVTLPQELSVEVLKQKADHPAQMMEQARQTFERKDLTEEQRRQFGQNLRTVVQARMEARLNEYFSAPADKKVAVLDRQIDEMKTTMEDMQKARAEWERQHPGERPPTGPPGGPPGGPPPPGDAARPGQSPGPGRFGPPTREQRKQFSESMSPDKMARFMSYMSAVRKRAAERGITMPGPFGGPPPGGRP